MYLVSKISYEPSKHMHHEPLAEAQSYVITADQIHYYGVDTEFVTACGTQTKYGTLV